LKSCYRSTYCDTGSKEEAFPVVRPYSYLMTMTRIVMMITIEMMMMMMKKR